MYIITDSWEGNPDINEAELANRGIIANICRLNDMAGGHHLDENFARQWEENSKVFRYRGLYFVYNPWKNGKENFNWLFQHAPWDTTTKYFSDIEVRYAGYSAGEYSTQVSEYIDRVEQKTGRTSCSYTGLWFLPYLAGWRKDVDYWWARYPTSTDPAYNLYPTAAKRSTWAEIRKIITNVGWKPDPTKKCPGTVKLWQCSGDRWMLEGTGNHPIDINLYNGSLAEFSKWWTGKELPPEIPQEPKELTLEDLEARILRIEQALNLT